MADYLTVDQLKLYLSDGSNLDLPMMQQTVSAASRRVDAICGRSFSLDSTVTARYFAPCDRWSCDFIDTAGQHWDLASTTGLLVGIDNTHTGTYSTAYALNTDFTLRPENGMRYGQPWPYTSMRFLTAAPTLALPTLPGYRSLVKITGKWGWPTVPDPVVQAALILAAQIYKNRDNVGGFIGFESGAVRVREDPLALNLLDPYVHKTIGVA